MGWTGKVDSMTSRIVALALAATFAAACTKSNTAAPTPSGPTMSFFVTSSRSPTGNIGGLRGADALCQSLATNAGAGNKTRRAYPSVQRDADNGNRPTDARSRIGHGPLLPGELATGARYMTELT